MLPLAGPAACPRPAFDRKGGVLRHAFSPPLDRRRRGRARRLGLARILRLQARRVFARAVVAVRAATAKRRASCAPRSAPRLTLLLFAVARLMSAMRRTRSRPPTAADLADAERVIAAPIRDVTLPGPCSRDKALLFDDTRAGFVMYGVQGRTWVALGDPVCAPEQRSDLIRAFLERCDDFGGMPVFYEIGKEHLHRYADFGLTFVKLGEEARVDLRRVHAGGAAGARSIARRCGGSRRTARPSASSIAPTCRRS